MSGGEAGGLMHGPTFMANPLACAIASANLDLLASRDTEAEVGRIERGLGAGLERAASLSRSERCGCWEPSVSCTCASPCGWRR